MKAEKALLVGGKWNCCGAAGGGKLCKVKGPTLKVKAAQDGTKGSRSIAIMSKVMTSNTCITTCLLCASESHVC